MVNKSEESPFVMNKDTKEWSEQWLSPARLSPYFEVCGRDPELALDLYLWNVGLCQVLVADFSHFEVALRNAYDRTLCVNWNGRDHWLLDDSSPVRTPIMRLSKSKQLLDVNVANRKAISQAQNRCYDPSNPNQVISNLMMGFGRTLLTVVENAIYGFHIFIMHGRSESTVLSYIKRFPQLIRCAIALLTTSVSSIPNPMLFFLQLLTLT